MNFPSLGKFEPTVAKQGLVVLNSSLIEESRATVVLAVNSTLTMLYWHVGKRISEALLKGERATYGDEIILTLSRQLISEYGNGYSAKNLRHMIKFSEAFPEEKIVSALRRQ